MTDLFNIPTVMLCFSASSIIIAMFVTAMWMKDRREPAMLCWTLALWSGVFGILFLALRAQLPFWLTVGLGNSLAILTCGLFWLGVRAFDGLPLSFSLACGGAVTWIAALLLVPGFAGDVNQRIILVSVFISTYSGATAWVVWRGRLLEDLPTRMPVAVFFFTHAFIYALRIPFSILSPAQERNGSPYALWYGLFTFELFLHGIFTGMAMFALIKDRAERRYRIAAETDALTGQLNRRAFLERSEALLRPAASTGVMLLLDLDYFKAVNDTYGHRAGDAVLVGFSACISRQLQAGMVFGRIGGEEFAIFAPAIAPQEGLLFAERVRTSLADMVTPVGPHALRVTVSIGLCGVAGNVTDLSGLMAIADNALYVAKAEGRNRVSLADPAASLKLFSDGIAAGDAGIGQPGQAASAV